MGIHEHVFLCTFLRVRMCLCISQYIGVCAGPGNCSGPGFSDVIGGCRGPDPLALPGKGLPILTPPLPPSLISHYTNMELTHPLTLFPQPRVSIPNPYPLLGKLLRVLEAWLQCHLLPGASLSP